MPTVEIYEGLGRMHAGIRRKSYDNYGRAKYRSDVIDIADASLVMNRWDAHELPNAFDLVSPANRERCERLWADCQDPDEFRAFTTAEQAKSLVREGWSEGTDRLIQLASEVTPPSAQSRQRKPVWSDSGDELHIDRAMRGDFDTAWRTARRVVTTGVNTVDLYATIGGHVDQTADELFWRGATCAVLTDVLESSGYRVRVIGSSITFHPSGLLRTDITIKEADEALTLATLASITCHAGVFRSLVLAANGHSPKRVDSSFGITWDWNRVEGQLRQAGVWPEGSVMMRAVYDRSSCQAEISRVLASLTESR